MGLTVGSGGQGGDRGQTNPLPTTTLGMALSQLGLSFQKGFGIVCCLVLRNPPPFLNLSLISHQESLCNRIPHAILALWEPVNKTQMLILTSTALSAKK